MWVYMVYVLAHACVHMCMCMLDIEIFFDHSLIYFSGQSLNEHRAQQFGQVGWAVSIRGHHGLWLQMWAASHGFYMNAKVPMSVLQLTYSPSHLSGNFISICDMKSDVNYLVMCTVTIWVAWWRLYQSYYDFSTWQTTKWRKVSWPTVSEIPRTRRLGSVNCSHCGNSCCMQMLLPSSCPVKAETWLQLDQLQPSRATLSDPPLQQDSTS